MTMRTTLLLSLLLAPAAAWRRAPVMAAGPSRREAIGTAAAGLGLGLGLGFVKPATAAAPAADVVILGASGRTGRAAAAYAVSKGMSVAAGTRSGKMPDGMDLGSAGSSVAADVKDYEQLLSAVRGAGAVIYAASASNKKDFKKADDARAVDYDGQP
uniref:NAD(P)-binding domain-containing protein n=1 Tax=Phaeomonas parva TaxID=124430 RepID=A0A7S1TWU4_9STRA|mmetsp:Transcript_20721/g.63032  ORF Transcript_20721/g.63032 Transcript_20721/m.63032 type:complete len:157 (+) Transcript_20721:146-616(+)